MRITGLVLGLPFVWQVPGNVRKVQPGTVFRAHIDCPLLTTPVAGPGSFNGVRGTVRMNGK